MLFYHSISFPNDRFVPVHCISLVLSFFRGDISDTHSILQSDFTGSSPLYPGKIESHSLVNQ